MKTPIEKIYEMLENNDTSNLAEMKQWFLMEEKAFCVSFTEWLIKKCDFQKHGVWLYKGMEFTQSELYDIFYTQS
jgi:hypothetical protein